MEVVVEQILKPHPAMNRKFQRSAGAQRVGCRPIALDLLQRRSSSWRAEGLVELPGGRSAWRLRLERIVVPHGERRRALKLFRSASFTWATSLASCLPRGRHRHRFLRFLVDHHWPCRYRSSRHPQVADQGAGPWTTSAQSVKVPMKEMGNQSRIGADARLILHAVRQVRQRGAARGVVGDLLVASVKETGWNDRKLIVLGLSGELVIADSAVSRR